MLQVLLYFTFFLSFDFAFGVISITHRGLCVQRHSLVYYSYRFVICNFITCYAVSLQSPLVEPWCYISSSLAGAFVIDHRFVII